MLETQAAFSRRLGVNRSHVTRLKKSGRLVMESGKVNVEATLKLIEATESPEPHHQAKMAINQEAREQNNAPGKSLEEIGKALKVETWRLQKAKAEKAAMEAEKLAGNLVEREEVDFVLKDFGKTLAALLDSLPDRLASTIAALEGNVQQIHAEIEHAKNDLQREISEHMRRKMEQNL